MTHSPLRARPGVVATLVFLAAAVLAGATIAYFEQQRLALARADAAAIADDYADILQIQIDRALSVTYALAALVHQGDGRIEGFETTARALLPFYENVQAIYLAPGGIVREIFPLETNEAAVDLNLLEDADQQVEARLARDTGRLTLAGPFELVQGGEGVVGRLPVFLEDGQGNPAFWGFTMAMLRTPSALAPAGLAQLTERGLEYALWRINPLSGAVQIITRSSPVALIDPVDRPVAVPNGTWTLSVNPVWGWSDPARLAVKGASGVSLALLLAALAGLLTQSMADRLRLEDLVRERTSQIRARESELMRAQAVAKVGSWTLDLASGHARRSAETERILGPCEGKSCTAEALFGPVHPDDRDITKQAWEAACAGEAFDLCYRILDGERIAWVRARVEPAPDDTPSGHHFSVGTLQDITEQKAAEDEIRRLAFFDPLTRLPNRRLLLEHLAHAQAKSARSLREGALLFIDLDNFKTLNDTYGHDTGDLLLRQVAERLSACVREGDTVARLGGDEFVVMLEDLSTQPEEAAAQAERTAAKIVARLNPPYWIAGQSHHSTPSIGITLFRGHRESVEELLKRADLAMYQAKAAGRNTLCFFDPEMHAVLARRAALEIDLRQGLLDEQFFLHYQPQVDDTGRVTGAEALLRWRQPERGLVSPGEFIPVAESSGLILPLGQWVLEAAARQLAAWAGQSETSHLSLAVNISARQFRDPHFVEQVLRIIEQTGANPNRLKLEITESLLLDDIGDAIAKMSALKAHGVGFSLDDFGTGYSSLTYLKRLPLDQLKIDQSFVRDVLTDPNDAAIACTIVALAQTLGLGVIAEGVETTEQRRFLSEHGCRAFQGYLFGRPGAADDLLAKSQTTMV